jgi:hypothetical protein
MNDGKRGGGPGVNVSVCDPDGLVVTTKAIPSWFEDKEGSELLWPYGNCYWTPKRAAKRPQPAAGSMSTRNMRRRLDQQQ